MSIPRLHYRGVKAMGLVRSSPKGGATLWQTML